MLIVYTEIIYSFQYYTDILFYSCRPDPGRASHLSMLKVLVVSSLGLYIGAALSQKMASFLEENDLFVPEDDDDDWIFLNITKYLHNILYPLWKSYT